MRAASTARKFDPTVLARPANCGGCAQIQGLLVLRALGHLALRPLDPQCPLRQMATMPVDPNIYEHVMLAERSFDDVRLL
jgi:hypothetical protein